MTGTLTPSNVYIEEAEIEMCKRHNRYFEDTKGIGAFPLNRKHWFKEQVDLQRDISLFRVRYSHSLELKFHCNVCCNDIKSHWYRCIHCIDVNLCINCFKSGKTIWEHLDSHEVIELRLVKRISIFREKSLFYLIWKPILVTLKIFY